MIILQQDLHNFSVSIVFEETRTIYNYILQTINFPQKYEFTIVRGKLPSTYN